MSQWALIAGLAPAVGLVVARRRLHVPPAVTLALASAAPLAVAAATPRRAWRYVAVGASYMWTFTVTWTLPYDEPEKLRKRLQIQGLMGGEVQRVLRHVHNDLKIFMLKPVVPPHPNAG